MSWLSVFLLAVAVSIDGFGAGFACGASGVKIPIYSLILMGFAAGGAMLASMLAGNLTGTIFTAAIAAWLGGLILIFFGLLMLWQSRGNNQRSGLLGLLDDPVLADADHSGILSAKEAAILGVALAMDGFGAGFGAALAGFPPLITGISVAAAKIIMVGFGVHLGHLASGHFIFKYVKALPGLIICALGILKIIML